MHELSIVLNIVEIAEKEAQKAGAHTISLIELDIGKLSTIEPAAFEFAWKHGVRESLLEESEVMINYIDGTGRCSECEHEFKIEAHYDPCPECGSFFLEITEGEELRIKSMRIEEKQRT